jgi:2-C-methyl-D-erythritol 4-phosphate cytidylyltransferase
MGNNMKNIAIIVAGGAGTRMKGKTPKQFIEINDKPVIIYTFEAFHCYDNSIKFILALNSGYFTLWEKIIRRYPAFSELTVVSGGETRFHSVLNALEMVEEESLVAIHDAVRPLVSRETISRCFKIAKTNGCAIPCLEISESVREIASAGTRPVDRDKLRTIQTPQVFRSDILKKAYQQKYSMDFTDDATVVENAGYTITLVEGNRENIKITTKEDLILIDAFLRTKLK